MPHEVDETTGRPLLVYNQQEGTPWHELGKPIDGYFTQEELEAAEPGLFFTIEGRPVYVPQFSNEDAVAFSLLNDGPGPLTTVEGFKAITRTDTNAPLGIVSSSWTEFQPRELFEFGFAVGKEAGAKGDVAMSLLGGRLIVLTLRLDEGEAVRKFDFDPSPWLRYLVTSVGNDGRGALRGKNTDVRALCHNTFTSAQQGAGASISIRHTANMGKRAEEAKRALGLALKQEEAFVAAMTDLSKRDVDWEGVKAYLNALFPIPNDDKPHTRIENAQDKVRDLFLHSPNLDGLDRTAYRLFQATGEYADHFRNYSNGLAESKEEARAVAVLDGGADELKSRAFALLSKA